jgi:8-amino-7-oxononanoate synthase
MSSRQIDANVQTLGDFVSSEDPDLFSKAQDFSEFLADWKANGSYSYHLKVTSACQRTTTIRDRASGREREFIVMASSNYLGLNQHPDVVAAAHAATDRFGSGTCGSRLLSGNYDIVTELEEDLADFEGKPAAMVFTSGYQANVGTISALLREDDVAYIDKLCHASIIDGCKLAGCAIRPFRHNTPESLRTLLKRSRAKYKGALLIVDGVFSMDGDLAPLPALIQLAKEYECRILVDEAHGTGVVGPTGRGVTEHFGVKDDVDITLGTFSKSLAATGGFIAADTHVVDYVRHYARSYFFSASPTPAVAASVKAALHVMRTEPERLKKLWHNIHYFADQLKTAGVPIYPDPPTAAIITVPIGPDDKARAISRTIYEAGLFVCTASYPGVAQGHAILRLSLSSLHRQGDLEAAATIIANAFRQHGHMSRPAAGPTPPCK